MNFEDTKAFMNRRIKIETIEEKAAKIEAMEAASSAGRVVHELRMAILTSSASVDDKEFMIALVNKAAKFNMKALECAMTA
jgi:hypothetical protein